MAEVKSLWKELTSDDSATDNFIIADSRIRLFNFWFTSSVANAYIDFEFRTGSTTGAILWSMSTLCAQWPRQGGNFSIPGGGIVFDDGLYIVTENSSSVDVVKTITVVYQEG